MKEVTYKELFVTIITCAYFFNKKGSSFSTNYNLGKNMKLCCISFTEARVVLKLERKNELPK